MNTLPEKELLRPDEVAQYYSVSRSTVYSWISDGRLLAIKVAGKTLRIPRKSLKRIEDDQLD